jgi:EAL and modified HD-GYP domain-containing signal transduction protein
MSDQADILNEVFLGRQPILDKHQSLVGYELLFRASAENSARIDQASSPSAATSDVVCKAFAELGLANVFGEVRAFINVQTEFLKSDFIESLPKEIVVLEVDVAAFADKALLPRCQQLKEMGYAFSLSGLTDVDDSIWPLVGIATWLKIDIDGLSGEQLQSVARTLATARRTLIAAHVETQTQMELCALLGFQLFQGFYFAKPVIVEGKKLDASTQSLMRLIKLIAQDADIAQIENVFRVEPALVLNLLRLTNSVGAGMRTRITSVRHAITVIGQRQLQRWLQLLLFSRGGVLDITHNPLLQLAALRGRFMELLVERTHPGDRSLRDPAFITGLMSVIPAALNMSMTDVLSQLTLDEAVHLALSKRAGIFGNLLDIIEAYDANDVARVVDLLAPHSDRVHLGHLVEMLIESLGWVQTLDEDSA